MQKIIDLLTTHNVKYLNNIAIFVYKSLYQINI